jgi:hypothetical protein
MSEKPDNTMTDKVGWEVEGFINRLTQRDDTNSERLVLEAVSHLRAFSRDCDALREGRDTMGDLWASAKEANEQLRAENKRLRAGLQMLAKQEYDVGYTPENFAEAILSGDEPAHESKP